MKTRNFLGRFFPSDLSEWTSAQRPFCEVTQMLLVSVTVSHISFSILFWISSLHVHSCKSTPNHTNHQKSGSHKFRFSVRSMFQPVPHIAFPRPLSQTKTLIVHDYAAISESGSQNRGYMSNTCWENKKRSKSLYAYSIKVFLFLTSAVYLIFNFIV